MQHLNRKFFTHLGMLCGALLSASFAYDLLPAHHASAQTATVLSSCADISTGGNYTLGNDIAMDSGAQKDCIVIHDTSNVNLDCGGHSISNTTDLKNSIQIKNVQNFSVKSCTLNDTNTHYPNVINTAINIDHGSNGIVSDNVAIFTLVNVKDSNALQIISNNFKESTYQQYYSQNMQIKNNVMLSPKRIISGLIGSSFGSGNMITNNQIDGNSDGTPRGLQNSIGADDGIIIGDENNDIVRDNAIKNVWDCGIETVGFVASTAIENNLVTNAGICGIGGWYWNSWKENTVSGNMITDAPKIFSFFRSYGLRSKSPDPTRTLRDDFVYFQDNVFKNNKLASPRSSNREYFNLANLESTTLVGAAADSYAERHITSADIKLGNNIFTNNDFNKATQVPYFGPISMIVDGGGNICSKSSDSNFPLACGNRTGKHIIVDLSPEQDKLLTDAQWQKWVGQLDDVYSAYQDLVGSTPFNGSSITIKAVSDAGGAEMRSGNPVTWTAQYIPNKLKAVAENNDLSFGPVHELGHDFDIYGNYYVCNTRACNGEHWANFKLTYVADALASKYPDATFYQGSVGFLKIGEFPQKYFYEKYAKPWLDAGNTDWQNMPNDVFTGLLYGLKNKIGWEPFKRTFLEYSTFTPTPASPATDIDKIQLFAQILSKYAGQDLIPEFKSWGFPISAQGKVFDTTPPTSSITSPKAGDTVSGVIQVSADARDNVGVVKVEFYLDDILKSTETAAPYSWDWDTREVTDGTHRLSLRAYDAVGNKGSFGDVGVTIANATPVQSQTNPQNGFSITNVLNQLFQLFQPQSQISQSQLNSQQIKQAVANSPFNIFGWSWAETIGWLSLNSVNHNGAIPYGVMIAQDGGVSGYAWSENIGWVSFNEASGCPDVGACKPKMDLSTGAISGWARACSGTSNGDCTGGNRADGWDGWIHLRGTNYGINVNGCDWDGWAWGSDIVGWIHFTGQGYSTLGVGSACRSISVDLRGEGQKGAVAVPYQGDVHLTWTSQNTTQCNASSSGNDWTGIKAISGADLVGNITASGVYTLTCTGPTGSAADSITVNAGPAPGQSPNPGQNPGPNNSGSGGGGGSSSGGGGGSGSPSSGIASFTAAPSNINPGQFTSLSWSTNGFSSCVIDQGIGIVGANGTHDVSPTVTTIYTLTCEPGSKSAQAIVTVGKKPKVKEIKPE